MTTVTTNDLRFALLKGESLLEGLERTGHEVEYQCRSGYCGACRLILLSGKVSYVETPLAFVGPTEILPCCCIPTEAIHIECRTGRQGELPFETEQQEFGF